MDRGRFVALKRRISTAQAVTLSELAEELVSLGAPIPEDLVAALAERMEQGACVATAAVASLVAASRNRRLYAAARERMLEDTWALITLVRADIPDPAIEKRLRDELYHVFQSSDDPRRRGILHALQEHGSADCIDDLEAIQYELRPRLQSAKLAQSIEQEPDRLNPRDDPQRLLQIITRKADLDFGAALETAILHVRERRTPPAKEWDVSARVEPPFTLAHSYVQKAEQHIAAHDSGAALNYCRKALEASLKSFIKILGLNVKKDGPLDKLELPPLIAAINSQVALPKDIRTAIESVQRDSTYGSHDQGVVPEQVLTVAIAQAAIDKYLQVEAYLAKVLTESPNLRSPPSADKSDRPAGATRRSSDDDGV